jgi:hypothetical protein
MTQLQELIVPLKLENSQFNKGIEGSLTKASAFGSFMGNIASHAVMGGINLLGKGIQAVGGFLADTVAEAASSQDAISQLEAVLKSTGGVAGVTSQQAQDLASSFQKITKFSDEAVLGGENMLLTFTSIGKEVFPRATETMLDMSQALGQDLKSSAIQLGKALNDPIAGVSALRRVGVQFSDEQEEMIKKMVESGDLMKAQTFILDELQKEFGGSAKAAGETFGGQLEILKNKLSDIKENIGNALLPVLTNLADRFNKLIDSPLVQSLIDKAIGKLTELGNWVTTNLPLWEQEFDNFAKLVKEKGWWGAIKEELGKLDTNVARFIEELPWEKWGAEFGDSLADMLTTGSIDGQNTFLPKFIVSFTDGIDRAIRAAGQSTSTPIAWGEYWRLFFDNTKRAGDPPLRTFFINWETSWTNAIRNAMTNIELSGTNAVKTFFTNWEISWTNGFIGIVNTIVRYINHIESLFGGNWTLPEVPEINPLGQRVGEPATTTHPTVRKGPRTQTRDSGGFGFPGESYLIGTGAQPELFTPKQPGTFTPNAVIDYNKLARVLATELAKATG